MNDLAYQCGTNATTHELRRLTTGPFSITQAAKLQELGTIENIQNKLITLSDMKKALDLYRY